ncbi:CaiB/BaiF CoA transferase family protein [Pollutimonas bauzanensis]|uniref:Crotonobetainyl-CoA:carnitine CoA-transferase CaiB n=1 Tax=Pollutimonas bauzanensis TaxID=658167 RepID=A0A1M5WZR6_9BURK|nr:CoA transferase [Pollutimonas bauzanensis]SHH92862.1 Crotonobetainyl-CoA:carnitine CoA-transferase CaiB [Pollutimonas bauzanensis]
MSAAPSRGITSGALAGLKVLDLTLMLSGPYCTMLLADQGADVVKVEPLGGEFARTSGPFMDEDTSKLMGGSFVSINRNKQSIVIDLKTAQGKEILKRLVREFDVLVENFRAGVMDRLGLGYEALKAENPKLVYACVRGFGDPRTGESPYADWPAYDVVTQAMGGIMGINGPGPGQPMKVGPGVGDIVPGMLLAFAIVSAVRHAERTQEGQFVDVAMYDAALALCERVVYQHSFTGEVPQPQGNSHPIYVPFGVFPAQDGWVSIACPVDDFWRQLCAIMGHPELAGDPRFATLAARQSRRAEVDAMVSSWTSAKSMSELKASLGGIVPFGTVNNIQDIFADPHVAARGMLIELEQTGLERRAVIANTPIKMTRTQGGVRNAAPLLGEHTEQVLLGHGYTAEELASLRAAHVINPAFKPTPI